MKTSSVSLWSLTATLFAVVALAQSGPTPPPPAAAPAPRPPMSEEMLKRFDANHDGKLDDAERAAAREAVHPGMGEHPRGMAWGGPRPGNRMPQGGPGPVCRCCQPPPPNQMGMMGPGWGRQPMMPGQDRQMMQQRMRQRFDADHDGKISESERTAAGKSLLEHRGQFQQHREELLARFDANHDGRLDESERAAVQQAWSTFLQLVPPAGK